MKVMGCQSTVLNNIGIGFAVIVMAFEFVFLYSVMDGEIKKLIAKVKKLKH